MKNIAIATVATSMLAACGFMTPIKQYAGDVQSVSDIAIVKGFVGNPFSDDFHASIRGVNFLYMIKSNFFLKFARRLI